MTGKDKLKGGKSEDLPASPEHSEDSKLKSSVESSSSRWKWVPTSAALLEQAEKRILACLKSPYNGRHVNIGPVVSTKGDDEIWTVSMNEESKKLPLVLLHGFGASIGFWVFNLDSFAENRPVYAMDMLGFGRSSRPKFDSDPAKTEKQFIDSIEAWRQKVHLDKFVLVGHSFGGYLATSYAMAYPNSVAHLILADPWGMPKKSPEVIARVPWYLKTVAYLFRTANPLFSTVRTLGPLGHGWMERARPDLISKFDVLNENGVDAKFGEYFYHCNAQAPSGETGFHNLMDYFVWSKFPLVGRMSTLSTDIDITAIYGEKSWIKMISQDDDWPALRPESKTKVHNLEGAGHHLYCDAKEEFNSIINQACSAAEETLGTKPN